MASLSIDTPFTIIKQAEPGVEPGVAAHEAAVFASYTTPRKGVQRRGRY